MTQASPSIMYLFAITEYYLDHQLAKPLMRIFEPILGEKAPSLCEFLVGKECYFLIVAVVGDHVRTVQILAPLTGGLMKFAIKKPQCLGCKTLLQTDSALIFSRAHYR